MRQGLNYWNKSRIQGLGKYILLKILKVYGLKDRI